MRFLIVGGSDAGISAALRARELEPTVETTVVLADSFPNYSICGLPFFLSGETPDWHSLAHRTEFENIHLLKNHTAEKIDPANRTVSVVSETGTGRLLAYDKLLIATGALPVRPAIPGIEHPRVSLLHTMEDSFRVHRLLESGLKSVVIVGSGYIGLEMADAFSHRGLTVSLVGRSKTVLPTVDREFGQMLEQELHRHGVSITNGVQVEQIEEIGSQLHVSGSDGFRAKADLVLMATGVTPNSELARSAGVGIGGRGAIQVNRRMETNLEHVYAAGDCAETWHRLLGTPAYLPLGTTAHKQGRIAGANALGGQREFQGSLGTQVVKVFDIAVARTGFLQEEAIRAGFAAETVPASVSDHKSYYPGAHPLHVRVTGDRNTGRLLGAQLLGHWQSEVAKRVDIFAAGIFHSMTVEAINDLDLSYTPPLGSPWDAVQMAAQKWNGCGYFGTTLQAAGYRRF